MSLLLELGRLEQYEKVDSESHMLRWLLTEWRLLSFRDRPVLGKSEASDIHVLALHLCGRKVSYMRIPVHNC